MRYDYNDLPPHYLKKYLFFFSPGDLCAERLSCLQTDLSRLLPRRAGRHRTKKRSGFLAARGDKRRVRHNSVWHGYRQAGRQVRE